MNVIVTKLSARVNSQLLDSFRSFSMTIKAKETKLPLQMSELSKGCLYLLLASI